MSKKSTFKGQKAKPKEPRALDVIEQDYGRLVAQAGQAQYNVHVYSEDLKRINTELVNLNYEGAARKNLDKQAAEVAAVKQVTEAVTKEVEASKPEVANEQG